MEEFGCCVPRVDHDMIDEPFFDHATGAIESAAASRECVEQGDVVVRKVDGDCEPNGGSE